MPSSLQVIGTSKVNNDNWLGTDLAVENGGTGASTAAGAIANLMTLFSVREAKTGAYTIISTDKGKFIDVTSGTWTLDLTASATLGSGFNFAVFNSGSGVITIDAAGSETIRDATSAATTKTLSQGEGGTLICDGSGWLLLKVVSASSAVNKRTIVFGVTGAGSVITTGVKGELRIRDACTITKASILLDQSGSIVIDVWKDTYANYPPTVADTITASAKPTVSSAAKSEDSTLTGWTTSIAAGDTLRFNVDSITTATRATLELEVTLT